ncbi:MucR family transcriptional regulator [Methylobacterium oryzisoli]|uniref:MucR family transcriptional regulator n=1 Tax=Methylobacterium oryzisoli TaxID=3385502 RepID=UPI0038923D4A
MAAGIVSAYVSNNPMPVAELPRLIRSVHDALEQLTKPAEPAPEPLVPPVPIRKTVTPDHIISLEDGRPYKTLKRHLAGRGLSPEEYRRKWGLPPDYPMVAANYAAQRSELAKTSGLGRQGARRAAAKHSRTDAKVTAPTGPKKGRPRSR